MEKGFFKKDFENVALLIELGVVEIDGF